MGYGEVAMVSATEAKSEHPLAKTIAVYGRIC